MGTMKPPYLDYHEVFETNPDFHEVYCKVGYSVPSSPVISLPQFHLAFSSAKNQKERLQAYYDWAKFQGAHSDAPSEFWEALKKSGVEMGL